MTERAEISDVDDWVLPEAITSMFAAKSIGNALETIVDLATLSSTGARERAS